MKLSIHPKKGVHVLEVDGPIGEHETAVLHAGVSHLLRDGKIRIVLDFKTAGTVPATLAAGLEDLHRIAREVGGGVAAAGKIGVIPGVPTADTLDAAIRALRLSPSQTLEDRIFHWLEAYPSGIANDARVKELEDRLLKQMNQVRELESRLAEPKKTTEKP